MKAFWLTVTRAIPLGALLVAQVLLSPPASANAGDLDPTFGTNGHVLTDLGSASYDAGRGIAIQLDGKLVVAGSSDAAGNFDFAVVRFNTNGSLDTSFGSGGKVLTDFGSASDDTASAVAIQQDGKVVVAGYSDASDASGDFAIARYNADGSLDAGFGSGGKVLTDFGSATIDFASEVEVQSNGKIVAAGASRAAGDYDFAVIRLNADGSLDAGFGSGGKVLTDLGSAVDQASALAIQQDGKIVVGGHGDAGGSRDFAVIRLNADGSLDAGFGSGGKVLTDLGTATLDYVNSIEVQPNGKIVAAGAGDAIGDGDFALVRYDADGSLDAGFGSGGKVLSDLGSASHDEAQALAIRQDGKIVSVGYSDAVSSSDFALVRYNVDGSLDAGFGSGGKMLSSFGPSIVSEAFAVAIQSDGKIVAAGDAFVNGSLDFAIARYQGAPPIVATGPQVSGFSPRSGPVGTTVTITGSDLAGTTSLTFNDTSQPSFSINGTGTTITTTVPPGATTGPIRVWTPVGAASSADAFVVTTPVTRARALSMKMWGHLKVSGQLSTNDGTTTCSAGVPVQIQRHRRSGWHTVGTQTTLADGTYKGRIGDRPGTYRAKVIATTLESGDTCGRAFSPWVHHS